MSIAQAIIEIIPTNTSKRKFSAFVVSNSSFLLGGCASLLLERLDLNRAIRWELINVY